MKNTFTLFLFVLIGTGSVIFSQTVTIGTQVWMTKNLNVSVFRNGDTIPEAKTREEWQKAGESSQPVFCYYEFNTKNNEKYGKLYNYYAVIDPRGLAPVGYHVPSEVEWQKLIDFLGGGSAESGKAGGKMKSKSGWNKNGNGDNSSGFCALPGGYVFGDGTFDAIGECAAWWVSNLSKEFSTYANYYHTLFRYVNADGSYVGWNLSFKDSGYSVRCLRD